MTSSWYKYITPEKYPNSRPGSLYNDVIMSTMASQISSLMIVYLTVYSGTDQRKHQSYAFLCTAMSLQLMSITTAIAQPTATYIHVSLQTSWRSLLAIWGPFCHLVRNGQWPLIEGALMFRDTYMISWQLDLRGKKLQLNFSWNQISLDVVGNSKIDFGFIFFSTVLLKFWFTPSLNQHQTNYMILIAH